MRRSPILCFALIALFPAGVSAQPKGHDFLHSQYDARHDSPLQQKFRQLAPMPAGVVYIQHPGEGEAEMRQHFRTMKQLGFTNLKQIMPLPDWSHERIQLIALEEGVIPWWYDTGGWEPITEDLMRRLGLPKNTSLAAARDHPKMIAYQTEGLKKRIERTQAYRDSTGGREPKGGSTAYDPTIGGRGLDLTPKGEALFVEWAKKTYTTIDNLNFAYNQHHHGLSATGGKFTSWEDFASRWQQYNFREYRIRRDIMRFKADHALGVIEQQIHAFQAFDPNAPFRAGGELGLFRPQATFGVDFEGIAELLRTGGSFYPSIHFSWHFDQVKNELGPTLYMQASYMSDLFKGGWAGGWETTGGPQQFDGERLGDPDKGFTVDAAEMTQFTLSMLAGGFKGWGLWCWSVRTAGKEAGEYALLDHHNEPTDRAIAVGKIGAAMQRYRDELWQAHKEPLAGVFFEWDNEAIWAAMADRSREDFAFRPMKARVGASRALINANVPFEYVTGDDLRAGLGPRYPVIYLPGILALNKDLLPHLESYVRQGGRLVLDMPGGWYDEFSALLPRGSGSPFARLFGAVLREYQYAGINRPWTLNSQELLGAIGSIRPEGAAVVARFGNGQPAVTEFNLGKGSAVLIGYEAGRACFEPGNEEMEGMLRAFVLGPHAPAYHCEGAIAYRLAAPAADHYFLLNTGPARAARLDFSHYSYQKATDAVTGEPIPVNGWIELEACGGRWIRMEK